VRGALAGLLGVVLILSASPAPVRADERVDITAMDGVQLIGELTGTTGPGVVLVHGERQDRRQWAAAAGAIAARGFRTLRFDLRGHGDSSGSADATAADRDVEGAYRYLLGRKIRPVFLVGEGAGATASLIVATRVPVAGLATLGLPAAPATIDPPADLRVPVLRLRSSDDLSGGEAVEALIRFFSDPKGASAAPPATP
jgi:pimeloyl-ACP methyl ester carboxylesterase